MKIPVSAVALAALFLHGCGEAPTDSSRLTPLSKPPVTVKANPVLAYVGTTSYKGALVQTVAVMNEDGSNQKSLFGASEPSGHRFQDVSWAPTGSTLCFMQQAASTTTPEATIKTVDVSISSTGTVTGTNVRTLYSLPTGDGAPGGMEWSSTSTMGKIAYTTYNGSNTVRSLRLLNQTGVGTPSVVWESDASYIKPDGTVLGHRQTLSSPAWNYNDQQLAVVRADSSGTAFQYAVCTIMIFSTADNGSTWTYTDSITVTGGSELSVWGLSWSRGTSGIDKLAYANLNDNLVYYVDPTTGAVPTTNGVRGRIPTWSPADTAIVFVGTGTGSAYLSRLVPMTTTVTNYVPTPAITSAPVIKWKR
ncbi:MAG TPA: hypothetical protein VNA88_03520 [Candidatus Kapabacteria bacterium]|jgi:hypothetical protein|nr:hypothetical protein [Candidatus Kapabacteria bacterium]